MMKMNKFMVMLLLLVSVLFFTSGNIYAATTNGWAKSGSYSIYRKNGKTMLGWQTIGGKSFYFQKGGAASTRGRMYTGWINDKNKTYYFKKTGSDGVKGQLYTGWINDKNKTYYFKKTGTNGSKGLMYTGWVHSGDKTYYFKKTGTNGSKGLLYTGWVDSGDKTYYFKKTGTNGTKGLLYTGWVTDKNKTYYFNETGGDGVKGQLLTGWQTLGGNRFYFTKTGANGIKGDMLLGWQTLDGKTYYFEKTGSIGTKGKMLTNTTVDGKQLGPDGAVVYNTPTPTMTPTPTITPEPVDGLTGKVLVNLGDSINQGTGNSGVSYVDMVAEDYQMVNEKYAKYGTKMASIGENTIEAQLNQLIADGIVPDYIVINGGTNDIPNPQTYNTYSPLGTLGSNFDGIYDKTTYTGAMEYIYWKLKTTFPSAKIIYVRVHNMSTREYFDQVMYGEMAEAVCSKWEIPVCNVFRAGLYDTNIEQILFAYGGDGTHPNGDAYREFYVPLLVEKLMEQLDEED